MVTDQHGLPGSQRSQLTFRADGGWRHTCRREGAELPEQGHGHRNTTDASVSAALKDFTVGPVVPKVHETRLSTKWRCSSALQDQNQNQSDQTGPHDRHQNSGKTPNVFQTRTDRKDGITPLQLLVSTWGTTSSRRPPGDGGVALSGGPSCGRAEQHWGQFYTLEGSEDDVGQQAQKFRLVSESEVSLHLSSRSRNEVGAGCWC